MKTSILKFLSILSLFVIISCHKDEVDQKGVITFTVNNRGYNYWIVLSDQSGKVLDWKAMTNGVTQIFSFAQDKDSVNLTLVSKSTSDGSYFVKTYTKVGSGDYSVNDSDTPTNTSTNIYTIDVSQTYQLGFVPQSENKCGDIKYNYLSNGAEYVLPLCSSNSNLYAAVADNHYSAPRYLYLPSINPGETLTIDDNLYGQLKEMKNKTITFNQSVSGSSYVSGNTINKKLLFQVSNYDNGTDGNGLPIYYPDLIGTLFSDYIFSLFYVHTQQPGALYAISKESQEPAVSYPELNINFNLADSSLLLHQKYQLTQLVLELTIH